MLLFAGLAGHNEPEQYDRKLDCG